MSENLERTLGRMEEKLNAIARTLPDHERRIRQNERFRWIVLGSGLLGGGGIAMTLMKFVLHVG